MKATSKILTERGRGRPVVPCVMCGVGHAPFLVSDTYNAEVNTRNGTARKELCIMGSLCTVCSAIHDVSRQFQRQVSLKLTLKAALEGRL